MYVYLSPLMAAQSLELTLISELSVRTFPAEERTAVFTDPSKQKSVCRRDRRVFMGSSLFPPCRNAVPMFQTPQASTICVFTNSHVKAIYLIYSPAECIILFYTGNHVFKCTIMYVKKKCHVVNWVVHRGFQIPVGFHMRGGGQPRCFISNAMIINAGGMPDASLGKCD